MTSCGRTRSSSAPTPSCSASRASWFAPTNTWSSPNYVERCSRDDSDLVQTRRCGTACLHKIHSCGGSWWLLLGELKLADVGQRIRIHAGRQLTGEVAGHPAWHPTGHPTRHRRQSAGESGRRARLGGPATALATLLPLPGLALVLRRLRRRTLAHPGHHAAHLRHHLAGL